MDKVACQFLHFFTYVSLCHQGQTKSGRTAYLCYFYVTGIQSLEKKNNLSLYDLGEFNITTQTVHRQ